MYTINAHNVGSSLVEAIADHIQGLYLYDDDIYTDAIRHVVEGESSRWDFSRDALGVADDEDLADAVEVAIIEALNDLAWEIERIEVGSDYEPTVYNTLEFYNENYSDCSEYDGDAMAVASSIHEAIDYAVAYELHRRAHSDLSEIVKEVRELGSELEIG